MSSSSVLNLDLGGFNGVNASLAAFANCVFLSIVVENLYATLRWGGNLPFTYVRVFTV